MCFYKRLNKCSAACRKFKGKYKKITICLSISFTGKSEDYLAYTTHFSHLFSFWHIHILDVWHIWHLNILNVVCVEVRGLHMKVFSYVSYRF